LPDIAIDIIDEAASEFSVKEEFGKTDIPALSAQMAEIEKMINSCEGKNPEKDKELFDKLYSAYDEFTRKFERLQGFWGHRIEVAEGGQK
jgi:ATP-dependent Clp protease ATP-binding subunit ClpA